VGVKKVADVCALEKELLSAPGPVVVSYLHSYSQPWKLYFRSAVFSAGSTTYGQQAAFVNSEVRSWVSLR
jgi:hypothetical protein